MQHVSKEELTKLQAMQHDFSRSKMMLGEIELEKQKVIEQISVLKSEFLIYEQMLMQKYGENSVINLQTGEVTKRNG
jgi:hypothetical protein